MNTKTRKPAVASKHAAKAPRRRWSKEVPAGAFRQAIGPLKFSEGDQPTDDGSRPFSMLARSSEPVQNFYFGAIYHDFAGMSHRDSIAVDYSHDDKEIIGVANTFTVDSAGLHLAGRLVPFAEGDRASEVIHKAAAGIPYEASIDFTDEETEAEEIPSGMTAEVNGKTVEGPALIFRKWTLRGVAICPHGMDKRTATQFSQRDGKCSVTLFSNAPPARGSMLKKLKSKFAKTSSKLSDETTEDVVKDECDCEGEEGCDCEKATDIVDPELADDEDGEADPDAPCDCEGEEDCDCDKGPDDTESELSDDDEEDTKAAQEKLTRKAGRSVIRKQLARFTDRFGVVNGTKWFNAGLTFGDALERHVKVLESKLSATKGKAKNVERRLSQAKVGESKSASSVGGKEGQPASKFTPLLGKNLGTFADSIKLPGRK